VNSARASAIRKMVNAITPDLQGSLAAPFHIQLGSYGLGPSVAGPRQTIQRDLFGALRQQHDLQGVSHDSLRRSGSSIRAGDLHARKMGPSVTISNGMDVINDVNNNPGAVILEGQIIR